VFLNGENLKASFFNTAYSISFFVKLVYLGKVFDAKVTFSTVGNEFMDKCNFTRECLGEKKRRRKRELDPVEKMNKDALHPRVKISTKRSSFFLPRGKK